MSLNFIGGWTILRSAKISADLDAKLCREVNIHVPVVSVSKRMGDEQWVDRECSTAYERKQLVTCHL